MPDVDKGTSVRNSHVEAGATESQGRGAMTNAGWNAFATLWSIVTSFAIAPVLIHNLGTAQYGILLLVWSFTGILGLVGFGFGEATLRYMAHYFGEGSVDGVNRVMGATLSFYLVICTIVIGSLFLVAPIVVGLFKIAPADYSLFGSLLRLSALIYAFRAVSLTYGAVSMALQRYDISSKIGIVQNFLRTAGIILLAIFKFDIFYLVLWDVVMQALTLCAQALVVRRIAPGVRLIPSLSLTALREIFGFSVFSFLTYAFHMMQRESGKMILGSQLGAAPVAYLGTPDNLAQRLHLVVASGSETLMPRFGANRDPNAARALFWNGTWSSLVISLVILLPLVLLLPDFLRLWISPEFARESATLGQLVALSYISQGAYAPAATFFRGTGKPWVVTIAILFAGLTVLISSLLLVPRYGAIGVGYAYLLGSVPAICGTLHCWFYMFGRNSLLGLMRLIGLPLIMAGVAFAIEYEVRALFPEIGWIGLFTLGGLFTGLTSVLVFGADLALGGADAPSRRFIGSVRRSNRLNAIIKRLSVDKVMTMKRPTVSDKEHSHEAP